MTTTKNNPSPTKVVSLRLQNEDYEKYASEASDLGLDLSPHLMEKLKWYDEVQNEKENLEGNYFDLRRERNKLIEEQIKLKAEIQSLNLSISTLRNTNENIKSTADTQLKITNQKLLKSHQLHTQLLAEKDEILSANEREFANLKHEKIATVEKMEAVIDDIIDKAHDLYLDAPVFSKMNLITFEKPLKKIYFEVFPKPENKPKSLFSISSAIANRALEEYKKEYSI